MKVGVVTQSYYPIRGGVTEHAYHLGRELERRGHEVTVITGKVRRPEDRNLRVIRIGRTAEIAANGATVSIVFGFGIRKQLRQIQERERFDLVHIHAPLDPFLPFIASETLEGPLVGTFHTFRPTNPFAALMPNRYRRALERLRVRIAVSKSAAEFVTRYFDVPFRIIHNGVDTQRFSPTQEPFPAFQDGTFTILFVGRMDPRKGSRYLFQALPYLERELNEYRVLVVGSGWRKKVYQQFVPIGLERRVHFAGFASWEDLPRYYRNADVYCSPAIGGESFGIVLLEAMSSEIPIVASNIAGYHHVLTDGREGLFSEPRNPRSIAEKIIVLARDEKLRRTMGRAGRTTALRHDWSKIAEDVLAVYQEALR